MQLLIYIRNYYIYLFYFGLKATVRVRLTKYLRELKKQYTYDVISNMIRESDDKFSRLYALLSLADLYDDNNKEGYYNLKKILSKAQEKGFNGSYALITHGLNHSSEAGLVEIEKTGNKRNYRLSPVFSEWVIEQYKVPRGMLATISTIQVKES